jgi:hypothetical protein
MEGTSAAATQSELGNPSSEVGGSSAVFCERTCLEHTCSLLLNFKLATEDELRDVVARGQSPRGGKRPVDPLEFLASARVSDMDQLAAELETLGRRIAQGLEERLVLVPFAHRLPTPSAFYQSHQSIREECQRILTPVLFNEETEVIGLGSINPVALELGARIIRSNLGKLTGTQPIISKVLLSHDSWVSLCEKQFGL